MRKPTDPDLREDATTESGGLPDWQIAENREWFAKWDAYCAECEKYDELMLRALRPGYTDGAPKPPKSFWGRGRPYPPHMPKIRKPMRVYINLALPLEIGAKIEAARGHLSPTQYITNLVTSILSD